MTVEEYIKKIEDLETAKNVGQAISVCEEALGNFPGEAKLYYIKANLLLNQDSPFDGELFSNLLKKATDLAPNWAEPHKLWAYVTEQLGHPDMALKGYERALAIDPQDADAWWKSAEVKQLLSDFTGSIEDATHAIEISKENAREVYYAQRGASKRALKDYEGALADYQKAVELNPNYGGGFLDMAQIKFAQQDWQGAIDMVSQTIKLFPQHAPAYGMRGEAKIQLNDLKGALQDFQQALFLDPKDERPLPRIAELQNQLLAKIPKGTQALHVTLKTGHKAKQIPLDGEIITFIELLQA